MGIFDGMSSSVFDTECGCKGKCKCFRKQPNPDPNKYSIKRVQKHGDFLIIRVNYPDCTNFEGNKIMVYKGCTIVDLVEQGTIDPHFSQNPDFFSPIARFKPDEEGWKLAEALVESLTGSLRQTSSS